ncbi:probable salivary secreted peptide [Scaptodrosophila lebanonensis]|uniref:Probable salivary secreted peptide n=1 Tax=Drosophila lebanonensis TaxID=7225 RepID=A0A6J2T2F9_DROLE|nr:probable salivary secreted peptide [Scaptodrosophila lebanonensis]
MMWKIVALLVVVLALSLQEVRSKGTEFGVRIPMDFLLTRYNMAEPGKFLRITEKDWTFEQTAPKPHSISAIIVLDSYEKSEGNTVALLKGGPGSQFAKLHAKSQRGHGFNFTIDVYGH